VTEGAGAWVARRGGPRGGKHPGEKSRFEGGHKRGKEVFGEREGLEGTAGGGKWRFQRRGGPHDRKKGRKISKKGKVTGAIKKNSQTVGGVWTARKRTTEVKR